tara:strand:- start:475 stop:1362 length:888 start_codon:yes stop_codon:yes gene_type:complete
MADVTNYTIENASGANVRTDLNSVFAAIQSSNSKSSDLATSQCVAGMPFLNTTTNILKIRNSSNNAFTEIGNIDQANLGLLSKSGGIMSGVLELDDSNSITSPALCFDGDEDTGLFRHAANTIGFSTGGVFQAFIDGNGLTLKDQNEVRFMELTSQGSNHISVRAPNAVASNRVITLPDETGTLITSATGLNASNISGVLFALGGTSVSRGNTITTLSGMNTITPASNNSFDLGSTTLKWRNIYTNDLNLSNENTDGNDIDGTCGSWTIQEGESNLYLKNNLNGKKYKINLTEVD